MRYSKILGKSTRTAPREAQAISHKLLAKAGYIDQLSAGIYSFLPLGWRVHKKIENIIREELDKIGAQEINMPALIPKNLWEETDRWRGIDPPLFIVKDRHEKEFGLGSTHEEVVTDIARRFVKSYKDLPFSVYQIQDKFRNEVRATGGLLRTREFFMKDLYSFHADEEDFQNFFKAVIKAYTRIFERVGLPILISQASGGTIGGDITYEFQVPASVGEDTIFFCPACGFAVNKELMEEKKIKGNCPDCQIELKKTKAIEAGQVFSLGTKYSSSMGATFTNERGQEAPIIMGCYGIGIGRVMASIVEVFHDEDGIIWPENVAPFSIHLLSIGGEKAFKAADQLYDKLINKGREVLFDDRQESPGVKLADADLIGIPERWVVSDKTLQTDSIEIKKRSETKINLVKIKSLL